MAILRGHLNPLVIRQCERQMIRHTHRTFVPDPTPRGQSSSRSRRSITVAFFDHRTGNT